MEQILWEFLLQHEFYHDSHQISLWIWLHLNVFICHVADRATDCCSLCHSCWPRCSVLSPAPSSRTHARLLEWPSSCVCITLTRPSACTGMITLMATSNTPPRNTMIAPESTTDHIFPMELFTIDDCVLTTRAVLGRCIVVLTAAWFPDRFTRLTPCTVL